MCIYQCCSECWVGFWYLVSYETVMRRCTVNLFNNFIKINESYTGKLPISAGPLITADSMHYLGKGIFRTNCLLILYPYPSPTPIRHLLVTSQHAIYFVIYLRQSFSPRDMFFITFKKKFQENKSHAVT